MKQSKFKVGDKVTVTEEDANCSGIEKGTILTIREVYKYSDMHSYHFLETGMLIDEEHLELYEKAPELKGVQLESLNLTKREYFAAHILACLAVPAIAGHHNSNGEGQAKNKAAMAVRLADALIKELEK